MGLILKSKEDENCQNRFLIFFFTINSKQKIMTSTERTPLLAIPVAPPCK